MGQRVNSHFVFFKIVLNEVDVSLFFNCVATKYSPPVQRNCKGGLSTHEQHPDSNVGPLFQEVKNGTFFFPVKKRKAFSSLRALSRNTGHLPNLQRIQKNNENQP